MSGDGTGSRQVGEGLAEVPADGVTGVPADGLAALADALGRLKTVSAPTTVTRLHSPRRDHCADLSCPCGLPPAGAVPVPDTTAGPGRPGAAIPGWVDGQTSALITWRGWEGSTRPAVPALIETWSQVIGDQQQALAMLTGLDQEDNVELVGAWLLPGSPTA